MISKQGDKFYFEFQKIKFYWNVESKKFEKVDYLFNEKISFYQNSSGIYTEEFINSKNKEIKIEELTYERSLKNWGSNNIDIPEPTFKELFIEQALAPLFIFQMFCVLLWMLVCLFFFFLLKAKFIKMKRMNTGIIV